MQRAMKLPALLLQSLPRRIGVAVGILGQWKSSALVGFEEEIFEGSI